MLRFPDYVLLHLGYARSDPWMMLRFIQTTLAVMFNPKT